MANVDASIDNQLAACIAKENRNSFFLFAGAGSGKTHSLVELLKRINQVWGKKLVSEQRKVAVITYTNAATDEIKSRIDFSPLFHISTIHSFLWDIIQPYQIEIKRLYLSYLDNDIADLTAKIDRISNKATKSYISNVDKLSYLKERKKVKEGISQFVYNPNGDNLKKNSLSHTDVIKIANDMISKNMLFRQIISQQFPFMLIDESQDTNKSLVDAFFLIQKDFPKDFTLGFIGDLKQRIYTDGKEDIQKAIPESWAKPVKKMNYRCDKRIIKLANKIAERIDGSTQVASEGAKDGNVHLFLAKESSDRQATEDTVCNRMKDVTNDSEWDLKTQHIKILTLEHRMAATRLGFENFHDIFNKINKYKMSYLQGTMTEMSLFSNCLFPTLQMITEGKSHELLELLKKYSPLLEAVPDTDYVSQLQYIKSSINLLRESVNKDVSVQQIVEIIKDKNLFVLPDIIKDALELDSDVEDELLMAWKKAMSLPLSELKRYDDYVHDRTIYATHQGVKGLEFPHVLIIIDDKNSHGTLFNYERLFKVQPLSDRDKKNIEEGRETTIDRTLRLLYVTCTRAKESLAIVMYTSDPEKAKRTSIENKWFNEDEITII